MHIFQFDNNASLTLPSYKCFAVSTKLLSMISQFSNSILSSVKADLLIDVNGEIKQTLFVFPSFLAQVVLPKPQPANMWFILSLLKFMSMSLRNSFSLRVYSTSGL